MAQTHTGGVVAELATRIAGVITPPARRLLKTFFDPARGFAATTFDDLGENPPDRFTTDDLLATTLLDMRYRPRAVRAILVDQVEELTAILKAVPTDVDLWEATDEDLAPAYDLWNALRAGGDLWGVGPTTTSKLMARKRPRLIPIVDSVVRNALELDGDAWIDLRDALGTRNFPERIERLRPPAVGDEVTTLRLLDVAVWMRHSNGKAARAARAAVGLR
jgi:hypothetical protein